MNTVVCTLFEGHYHYGVAGLVNSLYSQGFRGDFFAGYKGDLPTWADGAIKNISFKERNVKTLNVANGLDIHFLPIDADYHLTNYKPNFMIDLWSIPGNENIDGMFYFDPDIIVKINWAFFEKWIGYGVALVHELTSNDMPPNHPKRRAWEDVVTKSGKVVHNQLHSYINGGFCGLNKDAKEFLFIWKDIFETGVKHFGLSNNQWKHDYTPDHIFYAQDQDALSIAAMCSTVPLSEMGPEAMDFINGGWVMSHALGSPKPWRKRFLSSALKGVSPSPPDKLYWDNVNGVIKTCSKNTLWYKNTTIKIAAFTGRFYRKY